MKIFIQIFTIYLFSLSLAPCGDGGGGIMVIIDFLSGQEIVIAQQNNDPCEDAPCSPFCICSSCVSILNSPETQVVLPLLDTPLDEILLACVEQRLAQLPPIEYKAGSAVCIVAASGGYPDAYEKGKTITGIAEAETKGAIVFHAGTTLEAGNIKTSGGRVLGITALGDNFDAAIATAYDAVKSIEFDKMYYRRDIGHKYRS